MTSPSATSPKSQIVSLLDPSVIYVRYVAALQNAGICLHYAAEGALLVCADLQPSTLYTTNTAETQSATHDRIVENGGRAIFVQTDVTQPAQVEQLVQRARAHGEVVVDTGFSLEDDAGQLMSRHVRPDDLVVAHLH